MWFEFKAFEPSIILLKLVLLLITLKFMSGHQTNLITKILKFCFDFQTNTTNIFEILALICGLVGHPKGLLTSNYTKNKNWQINIRKCSMLIRVEDYSRDICTQSICLLKNVSM